METLGCSENDQGLSLLEVFTTDASWRWATSIVPLDRGKEAQLDRHASNARPGTRWRERKRLSSMRRRTWRPAANVIETPAEQRERSDRAWRQAADHYATLLGILTETEADRRWYPNPRARST